MSYVERLIERDASGKIKAGLDRLKGILQAEAMGVYMDFYERGRAMNKRWVDACTEILHVLKATDSIRPAVIMASMFLLWLEAPSRFVSDRAFYFQLVRAFRSLAPRNIGSYYNYKTGKVKRVYKNLSPKIMELMGDTILSPYVPWVAHVRKKWEQEKKQKDEAYSLIREGLSAGT